MDTPLHTSFLPMTLDESMEPFRVDGRLAVRALVRELVNARALVTLYAADDPETFIITCIQSLEADVMALDFTGDSDNRQALLQAPFLTVVGVSGSVKIQFSLDDVQRLDHPAGGAGGAGGNPGSTLTASVPSRGWRVQRRNAFRVTPPLMDQAVVAVQLTGEAELKGRLTDLSVGGLTLLWEHGRELPEAGATLRHCRIEAGSRAAIPCDLLVVRLERPAAGHPGQVSCEFRALPQPVSRLVQVYVMDIEKRARLTARRA